MSGFRLLVKNSSANIAAGVANALLVVALPTILVRFLSDAEFSAWSVVVQLAAIVNVFQFGVQVAVGRYVAYCTARGDFAFRRQIVSTAFAAMWISFGLALIAIGIVAWRLPTWFPDMPAELDRDARASLLAIAIGVALGLPASVAAGVYSGLQRNDVPAKLVVVSRIATVAVLLAMALHGFGIVPLAIAYGGIIGLAALAQLGALRSAHRDLTFRRAEVTRRAGRELVDYCVSLTIWSAAIVVISGLDAVIAGKINFHWAGYFGLAASVIALIVGLQSAMLQPLIAIAAHLHSGKHKRQIGMLLIDASRINSLVSLTALAAFFVVGDWVATLWVGDELGAQVLPIVRVLLIGIFLRQTLAPFAVVMLGTGEQRLIVWAPVWEAAAKLVSSIWLGLVYGPIGIALGTVVGAVVCLIANFAFVFPRVRAFTPDRLRLFMSAVAMPALAFVPILVLPLLDAHVPSPSLFALRSIAVAVVAVAACALAIASLRRLRVLV